MDWKKQELTALSVLAACCAGAAWLLDQEFLVPLFLLASAIAGIAAWQKLKP